MKIASRIQKNKDHKCIEGEFEAHFEDGSIFPETEGSWRELSEEKYVRFGETFKKVHLSKYPMKKMKVTHDGMECTVDVPDGCQVYHSIKAQTIFSSNGTKRDFILGKIVGIVRDGVVIEERFLDKASNQITGIKP